MATVGIRHEDIAGSSGRILFSLGGRGGMFDRTSEERDDLYMPARAIPILRPGTTGDVAILPRHHLVQEFADFCMDVLGLGEDQIQVARGEFSTLEKSFCGNEAARVREFARGNEFVLMPYSRHDAVDDLSRRLGIPVLCDPPVWRRQNGTKAALHPYISPQEIHQPLCNVDGLRIPRGFVATTTEELLEAHRRLHSRCILKPTDYDGGEGIVNPASRRRLEEYNFATGDVVLEESIELALGPDGVRSYSIHFVGDKIGCLTEQSVAGGVYSGTQVPAEAPPELIAEAEEMCRIYIKKTRPVGVGGIDFLFGANGKLYMDDPNTGRWTEAFFVLLFRKLYSTEGVVISRRITPSASILTFWERLRSAGIAWQPKVGETNARGVFPLSYLPGIHGVLIASGTNTAEVRQLLKHAAELAAGEE